MRRKDREVTDPEKIRAVIESCHCCRLGLVDQGMAYIVPLNFGFTETKGKYAFFFHGAREGRKIELMKKNPSVSFEMDTNYKLNEGVTACEYSARFQSIIGSGHVAFLEDLQEKKEALHIIMQSNTGKSDWTFSDRMVEATCVFRLDVEDFSCKEHL